MAIISSKSDYFCPFCSISELRHTINKSKVVLKSSMLVPKILLVRSLLQSIFRSGCDSSIVALVLNRICDAGVIVFPEAVDGPDPTPGHWTHPHSRHIQDLESYNQSSNETRMRIHCSNDLTSRTFGAGIELFGAVFSLLNGGLSSELEQFDKKVPDRASDS